MSASKLTRRLFPISLKSYSIAFLIVALLILGSLGWLTLKQVNHLKEQMLKRNFASAQQELQETITRAISAAKQVADNFAVWDESIQQIHNSTYYNYWRRTRTHSVNFVPSYFIDLQLYNHKGEPIADQENVAPLSAVSNDKLGAYITKRNNKISLFYLSPIKHSVDNIEFTGFVAVELDFNKLINTIQKFTQLDYSTLQLPINNDTIVAPESLIEKFSYAIIPHPEFDSLSKLMIDTLWQSATIAVLMFVACLYALYVFIGIPLSKISLHIDALNVGKLAYIGSNQRGFYAVAEFNKLRLSLNDYIHQLENLEKVAAGNLEDIDGVDYNKEATGLMRSFNTVLKTLRETMEEKDKVSQQLSQHAEKLQLAKEQALAASNAKSAFLANTSHEIRTPLTAIIGFAEASLDTNQTLAERIDAIGTIIRSGKHLLQVINDILDLSKVEANKLEVEYLQTSPFQIVAEVKMLIDMYAHEKNLEFEVNYHYPLPRLITTDPVRLKQIIINLCNNAVKFTNAGHVHLNVSFRPDDEYISFSIVDTGIGLSEDDISRVSDPFTQADASISRLYGGTGLGLSLSKELAVLLGGELIIESAKGFGSNFEINVTTGHVSSDNLITHEDQLPSFQFARTNIENLTPLQGNILVAEDNPDTQRLMKIFLGRFGINTTMVDNGHQAIDAVQHNPYDIVFMDMQMPVINGIEATKTLRQLGCDKPIIALTANAFLDNRERCMAAGVSEFITKPIDRQQLYDILRYYLKDKASDTNTDAPIVSTLLDTDPEFSTVVVKFITELADRISDLRKATESESWHTLKINLHDLTGISGYFGFQQFSTASANFETHVANGDYAQIDEQITILESLRKRIEAGLQLGKQIPIMKNYP